MREQLLSLNLYYIAEMKWMAKLLPLSFEVYAVAARQKAVRSFLKRYIKDYREVLAALVHRGIAPVAAGRASSEELIACNACARRRVMLGVRACHQVRRRMDHHSNSKQDGQENQCTGEEGGPQ